ncbi:MAG: GIY-YIG nuclease family protein [bacterium]
MVFRKLEEFSEGTILDHVPTAAGVYIIYKSNGQPVYVGCSRRNIRARLLCHRRGNGNRKIAEKINKSKFKFEWEIMLSVEQAEAQLIKALGTRKYFNLRLETDPVDRYGD